MRSLVNAQDPARGEYNGYGIFRFVYTIGVMLVLFLIPILCIISGTLIMILRKLNYIKTDAWRGYNKGEAPSGYISLESRWFCGFDGHNVNDLMWKFHQILDNCKDILEYYDYFYAILPTSNVFSQRFELYIRKNQKEEFLKTINEEF